MDAVSPVIKGLEKYEITLAEDQPQFNPLRVLCVDVPGKPVLSRWRPSALELQKLLEGGDVVLSQLTFGNGFQPSHLQVALPDEVPVLIHDLGGA